MPGFDAEPCCDNESRGRRLPLKPPFAAIDANDATFTDTDCDFELSIPIFQTSTYTACLEPHLVIAEEL